MTKMTQQYNLKHNCLVVTALTLVSLIGGEFCFSCVASFPPQEEGVAIVMQQIGQSKFR